MTWPFGDLLPFSFDLIAIDCAWDFETYSEKGEQKGPRAQYDTMSLEEIAALPVGHLARRDCLLLGWGTAPLMNKQIAIIEGWGFTYKTALFWNKITKNGKCAMGTGYRVRSMVEPIFVATLGNPQHKAFPGLLNGVRRNHSRKPEEFFQLVEKCCPKLKFRADIYSRQSREGWVTYGNEATKFDQEVA
jgi:N6-adenosine-specific RNA methylase IME4